ARFSPRSLLATLSFMLTGFATVWLVHHLFA
ncbi:YeeE/YedE family protein, partial [Yersinia enterocolitica]|nr:YeeE/YedE family protein [Yersinia enterocolitica]